MPRVLAVLFLLSLALLPTGCKNKKPVDLPTRPTLGQQQSPPAIPVVPPASTQLQDKEGPKRMGGVYGTKTRAEFMNFMTELKTALAAYQVNSGGKLPAKLEDIQADLSPRCREAIKDKQLFISWGVDPNRLADKENSVLAYEVGDSAGSRIVLTGLFSIETWDRDRFARAQKPGQ